MTKPRAIVADNVEAHWVTCNDVTKDIFFTDANTKLLNVVKRKAMDDAIPLKLVPKYETLYTSTDTPGGVAADNMFMYWGQTEGGNSNGSIMKAGEKKESQGQPHIMSKRVDKTQGVCLNQAYVFFTDADSGFYGAPKDLGSATDEQGELGVHKFIVSCRGKHFCN